MRNSKDKSSVMTPDPDQFSKVSQLSQFFRQRNQFVVAGDQNLQRKTADDCREDRKLVPTGGQTDRFIKSPFYYKKSTIQNESITEGVKLPNSQSALLVSVTQKRLVSIDQSAVFLALSYRDHTIMLGTPMERSK